MEADFFYWCLMVFKLMLLKVKICLSLSPNFLLFLVLPLEGTLEHMLLCGILSARVCVCVYTCVCGPIDKTLGRI